MGLATAQFIIKWHDTISAYEPVFIFLIQILLFSLEIKIKSETCTNISLYFNIIVAWLKLSATKVYQVRLYITNVNQYNHF